MLFLSKKMDMKPVSMAIAEIEKKEVAAKHDDPLPQTVPANSIVENTGTCIKAGAPTNGALTQVDYMAIVRKALTTSSDTISNSDLYLALINSNAEACKIISSLHQHGASDMLHFGFVLNIGTNKSIRFRVNGWWKDGFNISNLQEWRSSGPVQPQGSYVTIARSTS
jgi:hypothetical protein